MDWPLMLRPLPHVVAPFRDETIISYLHRLAGPNRIDPAGLRSWLAGSDRKDAPVPLGRLAVITGIPRQSLAWAMPQICIASELSGLHICDRPCVRPGWTFLACRACVAGQPVTRWALHDDVVCDRHRRWISKDHDQPDLTGQPEILHAHRRHRRLIRRHGRDPVMRAFRDAQHICIGWRLNGLPDPGYDRRMEIFCGSGWDDRDEWTPQAWDAATYPQSVALARLLASPYWRERILGNHWAGHDEFTAELRRTVAPGYTWDYRPLTRWHRNRDDPLLEWRLHTRRLAFEPVPPGHARNLPETIQPAALAAPLDHENHPDPARASQIQQDNGISPVSSNRALAGQSAEQRPDLPGSDIEQAPGPERGLDLLGRIEEPVHRRRESRLQPVRDAHPQEGHGPDQDRSPRQAQGTAQAGGGRPAAEAELHRGRCAR